MHEPLTGLLARSLKETGTPRPIPLTHVAVTNQIIGANSEVRVEQHYENREDTPIEATYVFPLESRAAINGFAVTIGKRRIVGEVKPRDEAFDKYDDALAEGHGAFLLDQERPNIFTASIGNLEPGQCAVVEISYVTELDRVDGATRLMIPTTIAPRYVPASERDHVGLTDAERVSPPVALEVPYTLDLTVEADLLSPIRSIESPSHSIRTEFDGTRATVTLAGEDRALDRDFVLILRPTEAALSTSRTASDTEGNRFVLAAFRPELPEVREPVELIFLVDCSGSMMGTSIVEARNTLQLCVQSLDPGDRFEIVRFGSNFESLFGKTVPFDDASLTQARVMIGDLEADLGGTEILTPLKKILGQKPTSGFSRRVILITDGEVMNESAVISLATKHRNDTRIFGFGIGAGASEHLLRGVAQASGGAAEFVAPGEKIESTVLRHFDRMTKGCLESPTITFEGLEVEDWTPAEFPPVAPGEEVIVIGRVRSGTVGRAILSGQIPGGGEIRTEVEITEGGEDSGAREADRLLATIWARRRIAELEIELSSEPRRGSLQAARKQPAVEKALVELGTQYHLVSSATSFVAIEERAEGERTKERAELRRIPVALTKGWGGIRGARYNMRSVGFDGMIGGLARGISSRVGKFVSPGGSVDHASLEMTIPSHSVVRMRKSPAAKSKLETLLDLQAANGSWPLDRKVAALIEVDGKRLKRAVKDLGVGDSLVATLVVLEVLERRGDVVPSTWSALLLKAKRWVVSATTDLSPPGECKDWQQWAHEFVEEHSTARP